MNNYKGSVFTLCTLLLLSFRSDQKSTLKEISGSNDTEIARSISTTSIGNGMDEVATAIRSGNVTQLSSYLDNQVDITLPDKSDTYSKAQAVMVIRDFFANNGVLNFTVSHKGVNGEAEFCIGTLKTNNGDYKTILFMKQKGERKWLQELQFHQGE
jgi:hypothetical protein